MTIIGPRAVAFALVGVLTPAAAAQYAIPYFTVSSGGSTTPLAGGSYTLQSSIGHIVVPELVSAGSYTLTPGFLAAASGSQGQPCYANCDGSTTSPILNVADFACFLQKFAAGDPYANCDGSVIPPVLNVADFSCFLSKFAAGCP